MAQLRVYREKETPVEGFRWCKTHQRWEKNFHTRENAERYKELMQKKIETVIEIKE